MWRSGLGFAMLASATAWTIIVSLIASEWMAALGWTVALLWMINARLEDHASHLSGEIIEVRRLFPDDLILLRANNVLSSRQAAELREQLANVVDGGVIVLGHDVNLDLHIREDR